MRQFGLEVPPAGGRNEGNQENIDLAWQLVYSRAEELKGSEEIPRTEMVEIARELLRLAFVLDDELRSSGPDKITEDMRRAQEALTLEPEPEHAAETDTEVRERLNKARNLFGNMLSVPDLSPRDIGDVAMAMIEVANPNALSEMIDEEPIEDAKDAITSPLLILSGKEVLARISDPSFDASPDELESIADELDDLAEEAYPDIEPLAERPKEEHVGREYLQSVKNIMKDPSFYSPYMFQVMARSLREIADSE